MNQVDWNKAPEGATHWEPANIEEDIPASWMKLDGDNWYCNYNPEGFYPYWVKTSEPSPSRVSRMIARPTDEWNGKGTVKFKHYPTQIEIVDEENELVATITTFDATSAEVTFVSGFLTNAVDWPSVSEQILEGLKKLELEIS